MPRRRMIDPKIWESDQVNNLSFRQRLLYIGLITMADDEGRLMNRPLIFKAKFFVNDEQVTEDMIKDDLNFLHKIQLIQIYGKKSYICHPNWAKYQRPTNSQKSDIPPPPFRLQYQFTKRQMKSGEYYGPNWLQQKKLARQRATGKCEHCGKNVTNRSLDVHHLQHFDEFSGDFVMANKLENLICLCTSCHRLAHTKGLRGQNTTKSISNIGLETTSEITPETRSLGQSSLGQVSLGQSSVVREDFTKFDSQDDLTDFLTTTLEKYVSAAAARSGCAAGQEAPDALRVNAAMPVLQKCWQDILGNKMSPPVFDGARKALKEYPVELVSKAFVKGLKYKGGKHKSWKYFQAILEEESGKGGRSPPG